MTAYLILIVGFVALALGAILCLRGRWVLGWLRGTLGLGLVAAAILMILYGMDLRYYQVLSEEQPVARVLVNRIDNQLWQVQIQSAGDDLVTEISGDEWQMDARVLRWPASWQALGFKTRYRLERISGRYRDVNQEVSSPRTAIDFGPEPIGDELWNALAQLSSKMDWLDAAYGSSAYHPLRDGAVYDVSLTNAGLISRPVNEEAREVLADWIRDSQQ